ncbi:MAG: hypothetical protein AAGN64_15575, partial [Bacteroidota bacterium]
SAKVFDPEVPLRASAGEIACRLLFEAKDDAAEALAALTARELVTATAEEASAVFIRHSDLRSWF